MLRSAATPRPVNRLKGFAVTSPSNLGFLSVYRDASGFVGGYLVTNSWGRPLEFRLTSAVQPTRVQQILYGDSLHSYVCAEVIGKTLIDKTATATSFLFVDNPAALELRRIIDTPIGLWYSVVDETMPGLLVESRLYCHFEHPADAPLLREQIEKLGPFDFAEPLARIREAMTEARKLGVATRHAA